MTNLTSFGSVLPGSSGHLHEATNLQILNSLPRITFLPLENVVSVNR